LENRVKDYHFKHFREKGWVNIDLDLDDKYVDEVYFSLKQMRENAISKKYKFGRVYYDHLLDFNLAAIELPFNNNICTDIVRNFFQKAQIGSILNNFLDWKSPVNVLSRLFCMGNYNYRGQWHRDTENTEKMFKYGNEGKIKIDTIQVGIYSENQFGFRILKKDYEVGRKKTILKSKLDSQNIGNIGIPINPLNESYDMVGGTKGSILLFDPNIFHQGSTAGSRFDFHMRFADGKDEKYFKNDFQDFNVVQHLKSDFTDNFPDSISIIKRQSHKLRLINTFNYLFPIYNIYRMLKDSQNIKKISGFGRPDILSNTLYQKTLD